MNKLALYFFDEEIFIDFPKTLQDLKRIISIYFFLKEESVNNINLCYNDKDSTLLSIESQKDYNLFLKKNIVNLYLVSDNEIYEEYLEEKENNTEKKDIKKLNELLEKDEEYSELIKSKFKKEEDEILEINKLIEELRKRKIELVKYINKNKDIYQKEQIKIREEIADLQIKIGVTSKYNKLKK